MAERRSRRRGRRRDAVGVQPAEPEVQRHVAACTCTSAIAAAFIERLLARTRDMRIGDPSERDVYFGPVINERAVERYERGRRAGEGRGRVLLRRARLTGGGFERGHSSRPRSPCCRSSSSLFRDELFVPFLAIGEVASLDEALAEANASGVRAHGGHLLGRTTARSSASSTRSRPASATPTSAPAPPPAPGPARRPSAAGRDPAPREGRVRSLLRRAVHARAEPDGDRTQP